MNKDLREIKVILVLRVPKEIRACRENKALRVRPVRHLHMICLPLSS